MLDTEIHFLRLLKHLKTLTSSSFVKYLGERRKKKIDASMNLSFCREFLCSAWYDPFVKVKTHKGVIGYCSF